jgi:hypothetical protein
VSELDSAIDTQTFQQKVLARTTLAHLGFAYGLDQLLIPDGPSIPRCTPEPMALAFEAWVGAAYASAGLRGDKDTMEAFGKGLFRSAVWPEKEDSSQSEATEVRAAMLATRDWLQAELDPP